MTDYELLIKAFDQMEIIYKEQETYSGELVICIEDVCCFYFDDYDFGAKFLRIELNNASYSNLY